MTMKEIRETRTLIRDAKMWTIQVHDDYIEARFLDDELDDRIYKVYPNDICPNCGKIRIY